MKSYILTIFVCFCFNVVFAQQVVKGKFIDENEQPVEYLQVAVFVGDSLVSGGITDENGEFSIDLVRGKYLLLSDFFGKKMYEKEIVVDQSIDFGSIKINTSISLESIVVKGRRKMIERKVDRLVFNVENSFAANAGDAIDVLKVTPGIAVQNAKISMIGKSGVGVMVDGRIMNLSGEDLVSFIRSIPSDNIKSIEVISNPPAKYEAEGNSGLVNIQLKKSRKNSWNTSLRNSYIQTTYSAYSLGGNFSYRKGRTRLLIDLNGKVGNQGVFEEAQVFYSGETWNGSTDRKDKQNYLSGRFAFDYDLTDHTSIGVQYLGGVRDPDVEDKNVNEVFNSGNTLDSLIVSEGFNDRENDYHSLNFHFLSRLDTNGRNISIDLDYFSFDASQNRNFKSQGFLPFNDEPISSFLSAINKSNQDISNYSARIDMEHPLRWMNLSYGAKLSFISNDNFAKFFNTQSGTPVFDPSQSDEFNYRENTQAAYVNASKELGKKLQLQVGVRLENTQTKGISKTLDRTDKNDYTKWFPSLNLSYALKNNNALSLGYSKRLKRPSYWELNPFRWYSNAFSYSEGNPFLQPSFTDNYELSYNSGTGYVSTFFVSHIKDGFGQLPLIDPSVNQVNFVRRNYFDALDIGVSQSISFEKFGFWNSFNQLYVYYANSTVRDELDIPEFDGLAMYFSTYHSFSLNRKKTIYTEFQYWMDSPRRSVFNEISSASSLTLAMRFMLMKKNLSLSLAVYDVFRSNNPNYTTTNNDIKKISSVYNDERRFIISVRYKFGNKDVYVRERAFGNTEEESRAKN